MFDLQYLRLQPNDQEYEPSSIIPEGETEDRLTRTLSLFSGRGGLQVFWVVGSVEPTILTPRGNDGPFWASMRSFHVRLSPVTPSGRWLTAIGPSAPALRTDHIQRHQAPLEIGVPGESILNKCRGRADQEAMVEIAVWSARCARCMPALQNFQVLVDSDRLNREENPLWIWYSLTRDTDNTLVQDRSQVQIKSYPRMVGLEQVVAEWQQTTEFHDMLLEMVITSFDFQPAIRYSRGRLL